MTARQAQKILQAGSLLSLLTIFLVFPSLLFPYITSKQLVFNLLIEALFPIWLFLMWRWPQLRPPKKLIAYGIIAYLGAILLSTFFSSDFNLSFWGDAERMLGWFHLVHYFLLYFYLIAAFTTKEDWRWVLGFSVTLAVIQSVVILFYRPIGTIGNTAYISGYLIFNLYFAFILFLRSRNVWRYAWLLSLVPMFWAFAQAKTSGAIIGLTFSVLLLLLCLGIFSTSRSWRAWSWGVFLTGMVALILLFSQASQPWFQNNAFLRGLTFNKPTFQTRLVSWEGAWKEFSNHPVMGVGFGNYASIFDRQFDPRFLDYDRSATYFDRAHNNIIDIASTTGLVGLITYLSIFIAALYYLKQLFKEQNNRVLPGMAGDKAREVLILFALLTAYFIQNLAVFDTQTTYLSLMILFGYLTFLVTYGSPTVAAPNPNSQQIPPASTAFKIIFPLVILLVILVAYLANYRPWLVFKGTIAGYAQIVNGETMAGLETYRQAISLGTPLDRDARQILINFFGSNSNVIAKLPSAEIGPAVEFILDLGEKNLAYNPADSLTNLQQTKALQAAALIYQDHELGEKYLEQALEKIEQAIAASPRRLPLYLVKAQIFLVQDRLDEYYETTNYAISLNPNIPEPYCQLAQVNFLFEKQEAALENLKDCQARNGLSLVGYSPLLVYAFEQYDEAADYQAALNILERLVYLQSEDPVVFIQLARINMLLGNTEKALLAAQGAVQLDPSLKGSLDEFLAAIETLEPEE